MSQKRILGVDPVKTSVSLRDQVYLSLKAAIARIDIYGNPDEVKLDERKLSSELGVSRTPVREALTVLEQQGFVRSEPRKGVFLIKKTKVEIVGMIYALAALEGMAARLACENATDENIKALRKDFPEFYDATIGHHIDDYSDANILFHQSIIALGNCNIIESITGNLFLHVRGIRSIAIREDDRVSTSMKEHQEIIQALERRDGILSEHLVKSHAMGLATHVQNQHYNFERVADPH